MKIFFLLGILLSAIIAGSIGLFETPDSIQYVLLGQYLETGKFIPMGPFNYSSPSTLFGPVYGLLVAPLLSLPWPWGITLIPAFQFLLIILSAILLYKIFTRLLSKHVAFAGCMLFVFFPFQIVYGTYLMSETLAQFLVTVYMYVLSRLNRRWWATTDTLLFVAAVLTLTRYVFVVLFIVTLGYWFFSSRKRFVGFIGVLLIGAWMLFNLSLYGKLQLTSHTGRHLYDNVIALGRVLPASNPPDTQLFFARIPSTLVFRPWWENQAYFPDIDELTVDRMFLSLSISAITSHPLSWLGTIAYAFIHTPLTSPYQKAPYLSLDMYDLLSTCPKEARMIWNKNIQSTPIQQCEINRLWNTFLVAQIGLYPFVAAVFLGLAFIGVVVAFGRGGTMRQYAMIFLLIHLTQSATEWVEGRFMIPLYPLYIFFIVLGIVFLYEKSPFSHHRHPGVQ